jgi:hypothetical protein
MEGFPGMYMSRVKTEDGLIRVTFGPPIIDRIQYPCHVGDLAGYADLGGELGFCDFRETMAITQECGWLFRYQVLDIPYISIRHCFEGEGIGELCAREMVEVARMKGTHISFTSPNKYCTRMAERIGHDELGTMEYESDGRAILIKLRKSLPPTQEKLQK